MLQEVEVSASFFPKGVRDKGFLIQTEAEFCAYFEIEEDKLLNDFRVAIKSEMPVSKWDHIYGLLGFSTSIAMINGSVPIIEASKILSQKQSNILKKISEGKRIFINKNGGYHEFKDETHTVHSQVNYEFDKKSSINIAKKASLINLENDPELEKRTLAYFKESKLEVSSIVNLRQFSKSELINIFDDFSVCGGHGVYVYTTGSDVSQVYSYISSIMESKLNTLILEVNSEITKELQKAIDYASKNIKYFHLQ